MARPLTLDEKISIKGELVRYKVPPHILARLTMDEACYLYSLCTGRQAGSTFQQPTMVVQTRGRSWS